MVIAAYVAMAIWCGGPVLVWVIKVPKVFDGAVDVSQAVPSEAPRAI